MDVSNNHSTRISGGGAELNSPDEPPIFSAILTPYRSLGKAGFAALMGFVFFTCFLSGLGFLFMGAWPIFVFLMLDVLLIWGAFHLSYRQARAREEVAVWRDELRVKKTTPGGRSRLFSFNPFWTHFKVDRHEAIGIVRMGLEDRSKALDIGSFLNPEDRESFANAFGAALIRAKS